MRKSAADLIKLPVFDSVRQPELEQPAEIKLAMEEDLPGAYNYETGTSQ